MRVILEGIDGAGKSSVLRALGLQSSELTKPPKNVTPLQWADYFRKAYDDNDALSRCHVSEQVYGNLIRGKSLIDDWQAWLLEMQLRAMGTKIFYLWTPEHQIRARILSRKEQASDYDLWVCDNFDKMEATYARFLPSDMTTMIANDGDLEVTVRDVQRRIGPKVRRFRGIGYLQPKVFIVGEEFTIKRHSVPCARPFDSGEASKMVWAALRGARDIYLTNALYPDLGPIWSQANLIAEYSCLAPRAVIALGSTAKEECSKAGIKVDAYLTHPQYWKRFRYPEKHAWETELGQIVEHYCG